MRSLFDLTGKVALVTGAARGIGLETARLLAAAGARIALLDRDGPAVDAAASSLAAEQADIYAQTTDITDNAALANAFAATVARFDRLDILVNNAAVVQRRPAVEMTPDLWRKAMAVNLDAAFECCRLAHPHMARASSGAIVNIASIMALSGGGLYPIASYHASKGGMVNLTRGLAMEWGREGIRVNAIAPTWIKTDFNREFLESEGTEERLLASMPLGRFATTLDAAAAVLYLVSPAAAMVTGHVLPVDGGYLAH
ncbi:glucose 1-dehydrogenase [Rhizobium sp. ARZ01]|nr:glucose 1-dehydrogenase [Rhizobium sp. ARZ01]